MRRRKTCPQWCAGCPSSAARQSSRGRGLGLSLDQVTHGHGTPQRRARARGRSARRRHGDGRHARHFSEHGEAEPLAELTERRLAGKTVGVVARETERPLEGLVGIAGPGAGVPVHRPLALEEAQGQQGHLHRTHLRRVKAVALGAVGVGLEGRDHLREVDALLLARRNQGHQVAAFSGVELRSAMVHVAEWRNPLLVVQVERYRPAAGATREGDLLALDDLLAYLTGHARQVRVHVLDGSGLDDDLHPVCRPPALPACVEHGASPGGEHW